MGTRRLLIIPILGIIHLLFCIVLCILVVFTHVTFLGSLFILLVSALIISVLILIGLTGVSLLNISNAIVAIKSTEMTSGEISGKEKDTATKVRVRRAIIMNSIFISFSLIFALGLLVTVWVVILLQYEVTATK